MFSNTTTLPYLALFFGVITLYYLYVALRYYSEELKHLFKSKRRNETNLFQFDQENINQDEQRQPEPDYHEVSFEETSDDTFDRIEELIKRLKPAISEAAAKDYTIHQLRTVLSVILHDFPDLKKSPFRPAISELIQTECKDNGSIGLSEQEVELLWEAQSA